MDTHLVKSLNVDRRSRKRLRFAASKEKSKAATADVHRRYKRRLGTTSTGPREEYIHCKPRSHNVAFQRLRSESATKNASNDYRSQSETDEVEKDSLDVVSGETTLAEELDVALDRNGSAVFREFHHKIWPLVRSLPELLHHAENIVDLMLNYLLSPEDIPQDSSKENVDSQFKSNDSRCYQVNHATTDILHLLAVFSRDLRHEIHPWLHARILPRIISDLLNPPLPASGKQPVPLDVPVVEAAFRAIAYILHYDSEQLLEETANDASKKGEKQACLEPMRKYYGATLAHKRELVRRLSAETFAPLIRKLKSESAKCRHVRRVLRALDGLPLPRTASTYPTAPNTSQRMTDDAVDGVALLCFELSKGAKGELHSKGSFVVNCVLSSTVGDKRSLSREVASSFFRRLVLALKPENVTQLLVHLKDQIFSLTQQQKELLLEQFKSSINYFIRLTSEMVINCKGRTTSTAMDIVVKIVEEITNFVVERKLGTYFEKPVADLLCAAWATFGEDQNMKSFLLRILSKLLEFNSGETRTESQCTFSRFRLMLARHVFTGLHPNEAISEVGPLLLETALTVRDDDEFFSLVHGVASFRGMSTHDEDDTFFPQNAHLCNLKPALVSALLDRILLPGQESNNVQKSIVAARCAAFVVVCTCRQNNWVQSYKKVTQWLAKLLALSMERKQWTTDSVLLFSSGMEAFALLSSIALDYSLDPEIVELQLMRVRSICEKALLQNPSSICMLKSCAVFCQVMHRLAKYLCDDPNPIFEALTPNLHDLVHLKRLHTLQILVTFPKKAFIVDHAALDLSDDIDEEPSRSSSALRVNDKGPVGVCDLVDVLLEAESLPVELDSERTMHSLLSKIEAVSRSGKIPVLYVDVVVCHLMGLLHVKFSPVWKPAIKALGAVIRSHGQSSWPFVFEKLSGLTAVGGSKSIEITESEPVTPQPEGFDLQAHFSALEIWESSGGKCLTLFLNIVRTAREAGKVSSFESRDYCDASLSLWELFENEPALLVEHSRDVVPLVLSYFQHQFFSPVDPDGREIFRENGSIPTSQPDTDSSHKRGTERQLQGILKAFAALKGPEQLVSHQKLRKIFLALLGHPERDIVKAALDCLLCFKADFLSPYAEKVKLLASDKMRDAMMSLKESAVTGNIPPAHRLKLAHVLVRILFGRMSSKSGSKTSKDSPSARRTAVFSFVAGFCATDEEVFPFLFLVLRRYLLVKANRKPVEDFDHEDRVQFRLDLCSTSCQECQVLPVTVHEGFLNVLEAIISQLGHRVVDFVPCFMSIILSILELHPIGERGSESLTHQSDRGNITAERTNRVRSLCYLRLAEMFEKYSHVFDFSSYGTRMWKCINEALELLPQLARSQDKVPSLLQMLVVLSRNSGVRSLLRSNETAIKAGFSCLSQSHSDNVVDAVLMFVENFIELTSEEVAESFDSPSTFKLVPFLLHHFESRFEEWGSSFRTWKRELLILSDICRLKGRFAGTLETKEFDGLAKLLVPFLHFNSKSSERDRMHILGILESVIPNITLSSAESLYSQLSLYLGPFKSGAGFTSLLLRYRLAICLDSLGEHHMHEAQAIALVVKNLTSMNAKTVNELDANIVLSSLKELTNPQGEMSWMGLNRNAKFRRNLLMPVIRSCFHFLFSEDGVIARSAFYALKDLIYGSRELSRVDAGSSLESTEAWEKFMEQSITPVIRTGVCCKDASPRRFFILLVAEVAKACKSAQSPHLFGDLKCLLSEDEPDLDFFLNITHVQVHRRSRALNRLRKQLLTDDAEEGIFSLQSLSGVIFPLVLHPIYESKTKLEEPLVMEAIATIGPLSRRLPWKKFQDELGTLLTQVDRQTHQERYIVGAICAFLSGFHFDVGDPYNQANQGTGTVVWKALENRIIPKIEALFTKEKTGKKGEKIALVRSQVMLGLVELYSKLPESILRRKLPRLITVLSDALKSHDSHSRDLARSTLAKLSVQVSLAFLPDILRELAITLKEGYQLHVRAAAVHSILLQIWETLFSAEAPCNEQITIGASVPALMDLVQQDLFGSAQDRRDAEDAHMRYVKEAGGSKSLHSIELIAQMIQIKDENLIGQDLGSPSGVVYCLVSPLLNRVHHEEQSAKQLRHVKECLSRVVQGLSKNPSFCASVVLPLVFATIEPCINQDSLDAMDVQGSTRALITDEPSDEAVVEWRPSCSGISTTTVGARDEKMRSEKVRRKVADGSDAPKLTGSWRRTSFSTSGKSLNDPTLTIAVIFGLQLLRYALRSIVKGAGSHQLDPFVPLLTECICRCRDSEAVLLAMRCLGDISSAESNLPSFDGSSERLAKKTLELLVGFGGNEELLQASFKMMTFLIGSPKDQKVIPLNDDQMELLLSFLQTSLTKAAQHNPAMNLIRALVARRVISPAMYDLMSTVSKLSVQSHKETLRQQSSELYVKFLINYPISAERMVRELKQLIVNIQFDGVEGRHTAICMVASVLAKFPDPVVVEHCKLFFLPLTMQLGNDESEKGRRAVSECLSTLLSRLPSDMLQSLLGFALSWGSNSDQRLRRASLSVLGIFVDSCGIILKSDSNLNMVLSLASSSLDEENDWELKYFALLLVEKLNAKRSGKVAGSPQLWPKVLSCLSGRHPWVDLVSLRLLWQHLQPMDPCNFVEANAAPFLQEPGNLFEFTRALCSFLDCTEEEIDDEAVALAIKCLTFSLMASNRYPKLCFAEENTDGNPGNPAKWMITRLSQIAKPKGPRRRQAIFKCFAAFAKCGDGIVFDYLDVIIEPLYRVERESRNEVENFRGSASVGNLVSEESQVALDVLHLLEQLCSPHEKFIDAYRVVKERAQEKRMKRSEEIVVEAARDPKVAAQKKVDKQIREKERRKRRVNERISLSDGKRRRRQN